MDYERLDPWRLMNSTEQLSEDDLERGLATLNALYDGEIAYADAQVGTVFSLLDRLGMSDNTMVVVLADHGEHLFEQGIFEHGSGLYESVLRVPLIVKYPRDLQENQPSIRHHPVELVDLFPTVAEVAGIAIDQEALELSGRSLLDPRTKPAVIAETDDGRLKSIVKNDLKLIVHRDGGDELFDLRVDAKEQHCTSSNRSGPMSLFS